MRRRALHRAAAVAALALAVPSAAVAQHDHDHGTPSAGVGRVSFRSSCSAAAQPVFERGVAMLHSFWFDAAVTTFNRAVQLDSTCAMAHWGIAMTMVGNPFTGVAPSAQSLATGLAAAERAVMLAGRATPREQAFAAAALALHRDHGTVAYRARMQAHEAAMRAVHELAPDDPEAAIFYARAIIANAPPDDLAFRRQQVAAALLEPRFLAAPEHPGLAHYIIHAFDAPPIAQQGLAAARRYADIAPAAPHALHMPSHIFTRLGYWDESIATNRKSAAAEPDSNAAVHPNDYMVYAYLQLGRDAEARRVVDRTRLALDRFYGGLLGYNAAAMMARHSLERGAWREAAEMPVPARALPYVEAIARFARAVGAARSGQVAAARSEVAALAMLRDTLDARGDRYWATVVGAQRLAAEAWTARAAGDDAAGVRLAAQAAELEESVEKHPVTPGPLLPARELEADLLLDLGRARDALASYEKVLAREPNRLRATYGAARAAEAAGDRAMATRRYRELLDLMQRADATREEPARARAYLARR